MRLCRFATLAKVRFSVLNEPWNCTMNGNTDITNMSVIIARPDFSRRINFSNIVRIFIIKIRVFETTQWSVKLNISGLSLIGFIASELGLQPTLHGYHLIGIIPKIGLLKNLTVLVLGANQLSGQIPHETGNLSSITMINLQSNGLTGMLPHELGYLKSLQGTVPGAATADFKPSMHGMYAINGNDTGCCLLPQLKVADFSFNFFGGSILKCLLHLPSASFQGKCLEGKGLKQRSDAQSGSSKSGKSHLNSNANEKHQRSRPTWLLALEIVTGTSILYNLYLITTYKRCNDKSRLNHENTANLLGYCQETPFTRMLVFEYACYGTLYEHLHSIFAEGEGCQLSRTWRMKIIIGIAHVLRCLHTELNPAFTISELNGSAVYLTEDFSPKLVDFVSWKTIIARLEKFASAIDNTCVLPNSIEARHLNIKGNVYAFGVFLLETVSGRPPFSENTESLVDWARKYLELEVPEVMHCIAEKQLKHFEFEDLKAVCETASLCLNPDPVKQTLKHHLCTFLEVCIDLAMSAKLRSFSLAWGSWAESALLT